MAYFIGKTEDGKDIYGVDFDIEIKEVKQDAAGKRIVSMIGSTPSVDRDGDTINQAGWDVEAFRKNPVNLWAHDHSIPAIARTNKFTKTKDALDFKEIEFPPEGIHPLADMVYSLMQAGFIRMGSVGFIPIKWEKREKEDDEDREHFFPVKFIKQELLELSIVNVGSNRDALTYLEGKGFAKEKVNDLFKSMIKQKKIIPHKKYDLDDESAMWNGPKEIADAEVSDLKTICTWFDADNADNKGAYKLPHHRASGYNTVWRGVSAAMGALLGARGGVDVPEGDRRGIYNHLAKHYAEFDKEPPEFKNYTDQEIINFGFPEDCLECGKAVITAKREKFAFNGKCPLCEECFKKLKGDDKNNIDLDALVDGVVTCAVCKLPLEEEDVRVGTMKSTGEVNKLCLDCYNEREDYGYVLNTVENLTADVTVKVNEGLIKSTIDAYVEKAGAVLNKANKDKLKQAIELINGVLASAEPAEDAEENTVEPKSQSPDKDSVNTVAEIKAEIEELKDALKQIADALNAAPSADDTNKKAPVMVNLEDMVLPQNKDDIDFETISKALVALKQEQQKAFADAVRSEIRKATGAID